MMSLNRKASQRRAKLKTLRHRDGDLCWICKTEMGFGTRESEDSATFDHLLAVADGGRDSNDNLRLAHRKCNQFRAIATDRKRHEKSGRSVMKRMFA